MGFREWNAVVVLVGQALIAGWLVLEVTGGLPAELTGAAMRLVWAIGALVLFNIAGIIAAVILVSIATRETLKDEKADERDRHINALAMRNAYVVASAGGGLTILALALGAPPVAAVYGLFAALMLSGTTEAVSQLVYYRTG
jgi:hypothetical protein